MHRNKAINLYLLYLFTALLFLEGCASSSKNEEKVFSTATISAPTITPISLPQETPTRPAPSLTPIPLARATSVLDKAHYISETYPDGSNVAPGATFQKTWKLQNIGSTTWTTDYKLVLLSSSPQNEKLNSPEVIQLPQGVKPTETIEISVSLVAPAASGQYKVTWQLQNPQNEIVSVDGYNLWVQISVGIAPLANNQNSNAVTGNIQQSITVNGITADLVNVTFLQNEVNAEICFSLPSLEDWQPYTATINVNGQALDSTSITYPNSKDGARYQTAYRCYSFGYPANVQVGEKATITIHDIRIDATQRLEENCARAQTELQSIYPELKFTCVSATAGDYYHLVQLPSNMNKDQARIIIIDAMEKAIYGPWTFTITR